MKAAQGYQKILANATDAATMRARLASRDEGTDIESAAAQPATSSGAGPSQPVRLMFNAFDAPPQHEEPMPPPAARRGNKAGAKKENAGGPATKRARAGQPGTPQLPAAPSTPTSGPLVGPASPGGLRKARAQARPQAKCQAARPGSPRRSQTCYARDVICCTSRPRPSAIRAFGEPSLVVVPWRLPSKPSPPMQVACSPRTTQKQMPSVTRSTVGAMRRSSVSMLFNPSG